MNDGGKILAIGDVHLGTGCSGLPDALSTWGLASDDLSPAAALKGSVDFAIEQNLECVLFAGDIVESTNARFEAIIPLEEAIRRLIGEGIQVVAVAGNHDVEALPRLEALIDGFDLLGSGGKWETRTITKNEKPIAEVIGWSFGERHVRQSPVAELLANPIQEPTAAIPRIGLLHADLDASGGHYAPIRQAELDNTSYDAWLLGHIHKPSLDGRAGQRPCGYLGSLVGLDPSETGSHGPWLVHLPNSGTLYLEQVPLAPLRWETVSISIEGLEHVEDIPDMLLAEAEKFVHELAESSDLPRALGLRAGLTGASSQYEEIRKRIAGGEWNQLGRIVDGTAVFFNKIFDNIELALNLPEIAKGDDPAALMAQRLLTLGRDDEKSQAMLDDARTKLSPIAEDIKWLPVEDHRNKTDPLSDDALRNLLVRSGKAVLHAMLVGNTERDS